MAVLENPLQKLLRSKMSESYHIDEDGKIVITEPRILDALDPISQRVVKSLQATGDVIILEVGR